MARAVLPPARPRRCSAAPQCALLSATALTHSQKLRAPTSMAEEYRILESVNYELVTCTPADWVCLFEARISQRVQHLRQRSPQVTGSLHSLLARVPSGVLASVALCLATMSGTAPSPWSPRQVALGALLGSSRAWFGSACSFGPRFSRSASSCSPHASGSGPSSERAKPEASFFCKFFSSQLNLSTDLISQMV